jgi:hypothetical protein
VSISQLYNGKAGSWYAVIPERLDGNAAEDGTEDGEGTPDADDYSDPEEDLADL